ncbi:MAG: LacI family transcriptional regulator, partial [Clostridiales bacterium]|nr:LacI family transcriptional regulator [Clostridiales bacterium]
MQGKWMDGRVTLKDIARITGYTINTVSRALNNKPDISRETSLKIQQA